MIRSTPIQVEVLPPERKQIDPLLEQVSEWMDTKFQIPGVGWRFGLDALLGLIPGLGDAVTLLVSCYILSAAANYGVPRITLARMGMNALIDMIVGCVPLVGDVFDVAWKANTRNVELLRRAQQLTPEAQRRARRGDWLFVLGILAVLGAVLLVSVLVAWQVLGWLGEGLSRLAG
jgi:hypothetical protein